MTRISGQLYPNQGIGVETVTDTNLGTVMQLGNHVQIGTGMVAFCSGAGAPTIGGNKGDLYFRSDTPSSNNQRIYICTVAGTAGHATWVGIV